MGSQKSGGVTRTVYLPAEVWARVEAARAAQDRSVSWLVARALEAFLPESESVQGITPEPSPAGRQAETEVALKRSGARATAPLRASEPAPSRASADPLIPGVFRASDLGQRQAALNAAKERETMRRLRGGNR